jgi:hypothetical protein
MNASYGEGKSKKARQRARKRAVSQAREMVQVSVPIPPNPSSSSSSRKKKKNRSRSRRMGNSPYTQNDYLATLLNPAMVMGVRIPDVNMVPTGTFQLTSDLILPTGTSGDLAVVVNPQYANYNLAATNPSSGNITWGPGTGFAGKASALAIYQAARVVSASLSFQWIGNTLYDAGLNAGTWFPRTENALTITSFGTWMTSPYVSYTPLRDGMEVLYKPQDNQDFEFTSFANGGPTIGIWASGLVPTSGGGSAAPVKVRIVVNYEGIAATDTNNFVSTRSEISQPEKIAQAASVVESAYDLVRPFTSSLRSGAIDLVNSRLVQSGAYSVGAAAASYGLATAGRRLLRN